MSTVSPVSAAIGWRQDCHSLHIGCFGHPDDQMNEWLCFLSCGGSGSSVNRSEQRIVRIAASLAVGHPVSLRDAIPGLDHLNLRLSPPSATPPGSACEPQPGRQGRYKARQAPAVPGRLARHRPRPGQRVPDPLRRLRYPASAPRQTRAAARIRRSAVGWASASARNPLISAGR